MISVCPSMRYSAKTGKTAKSLFLRFRHFTSREQQTSGSPMQAGRASEDQANGILVGDGTCPMKSSPAHLRRATPVRTQPCCIREGLMPRITKRSPAAYLAHTGTKKCIPTRQSAAQQVAGKGNGLTLG